MNLNRSFWWIFWKMNLNFWLQLCWKLSLNWSRGGILCHQQQLNCDKNFCENSSSMIFFPFGFVCMKSLSRGIYLHVCIDWTQSRKTTNPSFEWARLSFYCDSDHRKENYNFQIAQTFAIFIRLWIWICPNTSYRWRCWNVHSQTHQLTTSKTVMSPLISHKVYVINQLCALIWITSMPLDSR